MPIHSEQRIMDEQLKREGNRRRIQAELDEKRRWQVEEEEKHILIRDQKS